MLDAVLIDTRVPPPTPPERPVWEPDLRTWALVLAAGGSTVGAYETVGFASYVLLCAAIGFGARALTRALPYGDGLREYRQ
jgi:hypothetical protein